MSQVLVKWSKLPVEAATWEDFYVVRRRFPDLLAWGQASSSAGGSVRHEPEGKTGTTEDVIDV